LDIKRRQFLKANAAAAAASAAGIALPAVKAAPAAAAPAIRWDKAPCRFCGTGCGVLVGVQEGRIVGTQGDPEAEVNRGLNCVKGYFLSKIMYGAVYLFGPRWGPGTAPGQRSAPVAATVEQQEKVVKELQSLVEKDNPDLDSLVAEAKRMSAKATGPSPKAPE